MFTPSRKEVRALFIDTWQKYQHQQALTDLERIAYTVITLHPEYHRVLHPDFLDKDYLPEQGEVNPFLHMSLHFSIAEQLAIDQPHGIRDLFFKLCQKTGTNHEAEHLMMDSLAEMLWQANRTHSPPDPHLYLNGIRKQLGLAPITPWA